MTKEKSETDELMGINRGNEPTFVVCNRKEVIDFTLGTNRTSNLVNNWHVSNEQSLSDYRCILPNR
jgi:hypothetical protein